MGILLSYKASRASAPTGTAGSRIGQYPFRGAAVLLQTPHGKVYCRGTPTPSGDTYEAAWTKGFRDSALRRFSANLMNWTRHLPIHVAALATSVSLYASRH